MKNVKKRILALGLLVVLLFTLAVPAAAAAGDTVTSGSYDIKIDPPQFAPDSDGDFLFTGTVNGEDFTYQLSGEELVEATPIPKGNDFIQVILLPILTIIAIFVMAIAVEFVPILIFLAFCLLLFGSMIGMCIYILIDAPKHGMTKAWALLPLFFHVAALVLYLIVRHNQKYAPSPTVKKHTITCPTCNSTHPTLRRRFPPRLSN